MILNAINVNFFSSFLEMFDMDKDDNFPETNRYFVPEKWSDNYEHDCREPTRSRDVGDNNITRERMIDGFGK